MQTYLSASHVHIPPGRLALLLLLFCRARYASRLDRTRPGSCSQSQPLCPPDGLSRRAIQNWSQPAILRPDDHIVPDFHPEYCPDCQAVCAESSHDVHEGCQLAGLSLARSSGGRNDADRGTGQTEPPKAHRHPLTPQPLFRWRPSARGSIPYLPSTSLTSAGDGDGYLHQADLLLSASPLPKGCPSALPGWSILPSPDDRPAQTSAQHHRQSGLLPD